MNLDSFTAVGLFVSALYAAQNLLRYARAKDVNGVLGILVAAATGIGVVALAAHADVTATMHLLGVPPHHPALGDINGASQVLLGIAVGSAGTVLTDVRKAIDGTTSAEKPKLVAPKPVEHVEHAA